MVLAHPKYTKPPKGSKTDRKDAKWICDLFMCDMIKPSFIPPPAIRHLRDLVRYPRISGMIDHSLLPFDYPVYSINADTPSFNFIQSWDQVLEFRDRYRSMLDRIRSVHGEAVTIHLVPASPNPISFEVGKGIMKNIDPTILLYDKGSEDLTYQYVMTLHNRIRE